MDNYTIISEQTQTHFWPRIPFIVYEKVKAKYDMAFEALLKKLKEDENSDIITLCFTQINKLKETK